ncbi:hypothetical protein B296_00046529 [Ensete ventricosum]|uniref:GDSL esterase/lipase n=1 Tax=Ensete ventricosum TaxID=4639 RepID=A0A426XBB5_ENSVE|nr:hypothetical protein B296_00046529 [Ensete ventricosum]
MFGSSVGKRGVCQLPTKSVGRMWVNPPGCSEFGLLIGHSCDIGPPSSAKNIVELSGEPLLVLLKGDFILTIEEVTRTFGLISVVTSGMVESYNGPVGAVVWGEDMMHHATLMAHGGGVGWRSVQTPPPQMLTSPSTWSPSENGRDSTSDVDDRIPVPRSLMEPSTNLVSINASLRLITLLLFLLPAVLGSATTGCYSSIFSFGDSLADTGNLLHNLGRDGIRIGRPPYGMTYFHRPTGRFSDGRLIVDFIAQAMGLPLLPPYLDETTGGDMRKGVNFAVGGATAMENGFFKKRGIHIKFTNVSLGDQIQWFKQLLPSLCSSPSGKPLDHIFFL